MAGAPQPGAAVGAVDPEAVGLAEGGRQGVGRRGRRRRSGGARRSPRTRRPGRRRSAPARRGPSPGRRPGRARRGSPPARRRSRRSAGPGCSRTPAPHRSPPEPVAPPADRGDQVRGAGAVELLADVVDVDVDHVGQPGRPGRARPRGPAPRGRRPGPRRRARYSRSSNSRAVSSTRDSPRTSSRRTRSSSGPALAEVDRRGLGRLGAAEAGADPGQQLGPGEGLGQVVVGPGVEPADPVLDLAAGRQDQGRRPDPRGPEARQQLQAVAARQREVQQQAVERTTARDRQPLVAVADGRDLVALLLEPAAEGNPAACPRPRRPGCGPSSDPGDEPAEAADGLLPGGRLGRLIGGDGERAGDDLAEFGQRADPAPGPGLHQQVADRRRLDRAGVAPGGRWRRP